MGLYLKVGLVMAYAQKVAGSFACERFSMAALTSVRLIRFASAFCSEKTILGRYQHW